MKHYVLETRLVRVTVIILIATAILLPILYWVDTEFSLGLFFGKDENKISAKMKLSITDFNSSHLEEEIKIDVYVAHEENRINLLTYEQILMDSTPAFSSMNYTEGDLLIFHVYALDRSVSYDAWYYCEIGDEQPMRILTEDILGIDFHEHCYVLEREGVKAGQTVYFIREESTFYWDLGGFRVFPVNGKREDFVVPAQLEIYASFVSYLKEGDYDFWKETFERIKNELKIRRITFFMYAVEEPSPSGGLYNDYTPWNQINSQWNLTFFNEEYWKGFDKWINLFSELEMVPNPVLIPGKYGAIPFEQNINDVKGLWDENALGIQTTYLRKAAQIFQKYCGDKWWVRLSNEVAHYGDHELGHKLGQRHQEWYEAIKDYVPLERVIIDGTFSDFPVGYLSDEEEFEGYKIGKPEYDRRAWIENHGYSTVGDLRKIEPELKEPVWQVLINCGWKKHVISSDGGTSGGGYKVPGTSFTGSTRDELYDFCRTTWMEAYRNQVMIIIADLPMEIFLRNTSGILEEDFEKLDFLRLEAITQAWLSLASFPSPDVIGINDLYEEWCISHLESLT